MSTILALGASWKIGLFLNRDLLDELNVATQRTGQSDEGGEAVPVERRQNNRTKGIPEVETHRSFAAAEM